MSREEKRSENLYESERKSFLRNDNGNACPFKLRWSFGINLDVPVLNLTTEDRRLIAYASSHAVILYDYEAREILPLQGHQNAVRALSTDRRGKWLLSADFENDCVVVVWDTEIRTPICTLFNPHGSDGLSAVQLSPDAKYIATVGNEKYQKLSVWLWTNGRDKPDASIELADTRADRVKKIAFNAEFPEQLILLLDDSVIFVTRTRDTLRTHRGDVVGKSRRRYGVLNDSSYISKTHLVLTGSSNGFVLVWSDVVYSESFDIKRRTSNRKKHVKSVRLQDAAIMNVVDHEGIVVIGNAAGEIHFYDHQLRLLYWCRDIGLESIRSISFNLASNLGRPRSTVSESDAPESTSEEDRSAEETRKRGDEEEGSERSDGDYRRKGIIGRQERIPSNVTIDIDFASKVDSYDESKISMPRAPDVDPPARLLSDATLLRAPFVVRPFIALTSKGRVARVDIPKLKCRFLLRTSEAPITALDAHPDRDHLVTGNKLGDLCLYEYTLRSRMVTKKTPPLPPFASIVDQELEKGELVYATSPRHHESMKAVTALKYSPNGDMLACGLESGAIWILHPDTLDPIDKIPFKHSSGSILSIAFSGSTDYMAYSDDAFTVAVFRRNVTAPCVLEEEEEEDDDPIWKFLGKCHSHFMPVRTVLFGPPASLCTIPRFFSIAEDRHLVEYDLENSGPYPEPGLKVLQNHTIERTAIPLCLDWYPDFKSETFLVTSNSEYKFKLLNDITKTTRGTVLGPTFGAPVQRMKVLPARNSHNQAYMIFATDKEIGLQLLPFDGNPYKIVGMIGHPVKLANLAVSACGKFLFTIGSFDPCVLMWKINVRAVDATARLGGDSLLPFYRLIDDGGRHGWLINEMRDLFYYAQILQQGESSLATRVVSDKVSAKQLPNLMRAVGFYPSNYELENLMSEVAYRDYADTGRQIEDVSFGDLVKLYVNHRPAFGISLRELSKAFRIFTRSSDNPLLPATSREDFIDILLGKGKLTTGSVRQPAQNLYGDPLTLDEARTFLKLLMPNLDAKDDATGDEAIESNLHFDFLPAEISYKDFVTDVMGIELPEETRR